MSEAASDASEPDPIAKPARHSKPANSPKRSVTRRTLGVGMQLLRKLIQLTVVFFILYSAFGGIWRNYNLAHNNRRIVGLIHGDTWGELFGLNEDFLAQINEADDQEASLIFLGIPWAGRVGGVDSTDPMMALSHIVSTGELHWGLLAGLLVPLLLVFVFGKIFCSHICPMRLTFEMSQWIRGGLLTLGVPLPELRSKVRLGGWVLLGGLIATFFAGTSVWLFILPYVSLSIGLFLLVTTSTASGIFTVVAFWVALDVFLAPGFFCHNVCPTGFLLEQLGRFSPFKLRKKGTQPCPTGCDLCERVCPYGLSPRAETHTPACDSCGRCAASCPSTRLVRRLPILSSTQRRLPVIAALLLTLSVLATLAGPSLARAHHNKGLPHYGYFENYPQVPTDEYVQIIGRWEIGATIFNFQGYSARATSDTPNDIKIYLYLYDIEADAGYHGPLDIEIRHDGEVIARFDRLEVDEESVYSTRETVPESGEYEIVVDVEGEHLVLPFYVDIDDGVSPWLIAGILGPLFLLFTLAVIGRRRRLNKRQKKGAATLAKAKAARAKAARAKAAKAAQAEIDLSGPTEDDEQGTAGDLKEA